MVVAEVEEDGLEVEREEGVLGAAVANQLRHEKRKGKSLEQTTVRVELGGEEEEEGEEEGGAGDVGGGRGGGRSWKRTLNGSS